MRALVLAGGKGTRLRPFTAAFPKPLMPVGDRPILELVLRQLGRHGFSDVTISVGYLAPLIQNFFGDGSPLGMRISYLHEAEPLGTAGPLARLGPVSQTILVVNGDLLTTIDLTRMLAFHRETGAVATIAARQRDVYVDFGVLEIAGDRLAAYVEKPTLHYWVSMGLNLLEPEAVAAVPREGRYDLPALMEGLRTAGKPVACYRTDAYWLDIGRVDDYERA
ncbi:MAG: NTP transferase domain-containing protein, partial [Candidatus Sericytochromatia bacterium]|nr:NTP transferase domain-containing protein [Candidatus Tanganyikabacteria bacterium]